MESSELREAFERGYKVGVRDIWDEIHKLNNYLNCSGPQGKDRAYGLGVLLYTLAITRGNPEKDEFKMIDLEIPHEWRSQSSDYLTK